MKVFRVVPVYQPTPPMFNFVVYINTNKPLAKVMKDILHVNESGLMV